MQSSANLLIGKGRAQRIATGTRVITADADLFGHALAVFIVTTLYGLAFHMNNLLRALHHIRVEIFSPVCKALAAGLRLCGGFPGAHHDIALTAAMRLIINTVCDSTS